ncbi:hypothetical protein ACQJBY_006919 [Aegilops geniculata]
MFCLSVLLVSDMSCLSVLLVSDMSCLSVLLVHPVSDMCCPVSLFFSVTRTCGAEESTRSHVLVKPIGKGDLGDHVMGLIQSLKRSGDGKK